MQQVTSTFQDIIKTCLRNDLAGSTTLVYVYFVGHGVLDKTTHMATNGQSVLFPLEEVLRKIAHHKNSYVVGLLDCTRDEQPADNWRGIDKLPGEAMKIHQLLVESGADVDAENKVSYPPSTPPHTSHQGGAGISPRSQGAGTDSRQAGRRPSHHC